MNKKDLKMRPVGNEYLEQYNALLRYVFQVTDQELSSVGWQEKEIIRAKFPTMEKADVIGWFDGDTLVSQVAVYPMRVKVFGKTYSMGGLTGVGTYPEYSNMGLMHKLLEQALKNMREKKQYICYLYPYSIPYYRRKGWELISDKISYEIKDYQLPKNHQVAGSVRRVKADGEELKETYARFAEHTHGAILRDELAWNEYWLWDRDDIMAAIYYNENEEPDGYIIYWIENEVFYIKDMIFNHEEARTGLWNFVSAHFSMTDPIMECNQGSFLLKISKDGRGTAVKISEPCADSISIQTMTTMLMGYKRPDYLAKIGRIHAGGETIDMLEDAIEQQPPYISDYF